MYFRATRKVSSTATISLTTRPAYYHQYIPLGMTLCSSIVGRRVVEMQANFELWILSKSNQIKAQPGILLSNQPTGRVRNL